MTQRNRKIRFLKTLLTTTALFACPAVQADEISIDIDSSGKTATLTTGGTLAQDHTEELKNVILLDVAPTENIEIKNGVLAVPKTLNINSGTFGIASTRYDKATFEAVNGTLNINGGNFNSSAHVNFTLAGKTVNVLNNAVFSSSVSESGSSHPIYRIKGDNISFAGTAKSGRLQLYFIPYKDGGRWNISAPIEEYSVIFGEEESSGYVNPASMVEVSETIAATGMFKESPGSVKVNRGITVHFSKDVFSAHFFQNRGVVRLDGTLTTGFYGGFEDSALYGTGSIVMNVPDDGKSAHRALHNIGYNPTTGKTERFKSIVVKSQKNNSYGNYYITGQSSIETVTVIDSGINLMGRRSLIDIGTLTVSGYYDYSLSFGLFQVTDGAIANIGMLTVNETEAWVKIDSTLIVDKYKLPPKGSSTGGSFGAFLLQDGATFLRRNGGVLELDDFYQNGNVNIGGASTTTPATFGAGDWSKVYATGYVDLKGDGQNASKFYGIKGLSSDVASLVNAETGLNFIISSGAVEVKNIYGETGGKGVVKSGATLTADSVSLSINTSKIIAPTIQIDQDGRLNLQSSIEAFGGKNYVVFKGKGTLSVPKNIAEKLTETALYAFLDNLGTLEIDTSTGDNTVVLYDNRDNQDISSSIDKLVFKGDNAGTLQLCDKLIVRGADFGTNGKVHLITGSTLYFDVNGTLPANIIGTGTLGLLNSSKLELSDAAVGNLALEGLEIDGKAEAVIKADISIDKLKFMQDTGGTLGIDSGKTLTVKSGVTMGTGNKIDGANGALIVQGDSSFSNTVLGTLTAQKATFKGGNSTIGTYNAQGDVVVEAGTTLEVNSALDLSKYGLYGEGTLVLKGSGLFSVIGGNKSFGTLTATAKSAADTLNFSGDVYADTIILTGYSSATTKGGAQSFTLNNLTLDGTTVTGPSVNTAFIIKDSLSLKNNAVLKLDGASVRFKTAQTDRLTDGKSKIYFWQENTGNTEVQSEIVFERGGTLYLDDFEWDVSTEHESHSALFTVGNDSAISAALDVKGSSDRAELIVQKNAVLNIAENNATYHTVKVNGGGTANLSSDMTLYWLDLDLRSSGAAIINVKGDVLANTFRSTGGNAFKNAKINIDGKLSFNSAADQSRIPYADFTGKGTLELAADGKGRSGTIGGTFADFGTLALTADGGNVSLTLDLSGGSNTVDKLRFSGTNGAKLTVKGALTVKSSDFKAASNEIVLSSGAELDFDASASNMDNVKISGAGTLGLLNNTSMTFGGSDDLTLKGLKIYRGRATIANDMTIDDVIFMTADAGTLELQNGTLTINNGLSMRAGNTLESSGGNLILKAESTLANAMMNNGTLTTEALTTFTSGKRGSVIQKFIAGGDIAIEAGASLAVLDALNLSGGHYVYGDGSLTVGAGGMIATGSKTLADLTVNGETTFYYDSTIGTLKIKDGVTAKVAADKTLTISKSFSGTINANDGIRTTLRLIDSAQAEFKKGDSTKMLRFVMDGANARATFNGTYFLNDMELNQGTVVLADGATLQLSRGILSGGGITGNGTLDLVTQNTEITKTGDYTLSHLTFGGSGSLTLNGVLTVLNAADFGAEDKNSIRLSGSGTLNFGANGTVGGGKFDGTISVGQNKVTVESNMELGTFKFTQSAGGTLWINDGVTLTVGELQGVGSNTVRGGILKLLSGGEIGNVNITGELSLGGDTTITGDSVIDTVTSAGDIFIADGVTLTVNKKLDLSTGNIVYGDKGTLALNGTDNQIATKTKILGTLKIGESGAVTFYDDAVVGTLDSRGTTTVAAGKTLTIRQSYGGKLSASDATLKLTETAQGTFAASDGSVIGRLEIAGEGAKATFNGAYALNDLTLSKGQVEINDVLTLTQGAFTGGTVGGTGSLKLAGTLTIGAGAGVSISHLAFDTDGKLKLNGALTVNSELDYRGHLVDAGNGTLTLGAKGKFGGTFMGTVRVGQTTAEIAENAVFKALEFTGTGGVLTIADSATLEIAALDAAGNTVSGGNLKLTNGAVFDTANLNDLTAGADVIVNKSLTVGGALSAASVSGDGELTLTNGGSLTTDGKVLGTLSGGQATITGDSTIGALNADVSINAGKTLTITKSVKDAIAASGDGLLLLDGASADFGSADIKNLKLNNASVALSGVLTVDSLQAGDEPSTLTGGTLTLAGDAAFNGKMDVDVLNVNAGTFTFNGTTGDVKNMTLADGAKLVIATGELNAYGFAGKNNTVTIAEDAAFGLDLGSSQALPTGLTITGAGYLSLLNKTSLTFAGNAGEFGELGGLQVMRGTVTVTADTSVKNFRFGDKTGGTLNIENGTFSVSKITTVGDGNKITGEGTLKLTNGDSVFGSAVNGTKIVVGEKATALFNGKTVLPTLTVESGGGVGAGENGDVSIAELSMKNGKIFGSGVLKADKLTMDGGTVKVSGGLAAKTIENGTLEVEENGVLSLENSVLNSAGITMTGGLLSLKTDYAQSALNLTLNGGTVSFGTLTVDAAFVNAGGKLSGTKLIWAHDGELKAQADVDTLQIDAGLTLANDTTVSTLGFGENGVLTLNGVLTVNGTLNLTRDIAGSGTLIAAGDAVLGANFGGTLQIGTDAKAGTATVVSDAAFGGLTFGGKGGAVKINAGKRLSVPTVSVASGGTVAGDGTLALTGTGSVLGANLSVAEIELSGQATAQTASVNGLTLKDGGRVDVENSLSVAKLKQTGTDGVINGGALTAQSVTVENSLTLNNATAAIADLTGSGTLTLNGGTAFLTKAAVGGVSVSDGTLDIGANQIQVNRFVMQNGTLKLLIGKDATDANGNATGIGHGKITGVTTVFNSALSLEIGYNTYITKDGALFKLFDGSQNGAFSEIANEKYKITAEGDGVYRIAKLYTSAENTENAGGNKNQQNTADGLLDHPPFDESDKTYGLADELNRLEQSDKQGFLDGLTAAAPDVSGAVSAAHLRSQRSINSMTVKRLTALHDKLGRNSYGFRRDQKLMRGMRRGRSGGSRYYDARKYYQKAYGRGAARSSVRNKPYENYWSNGLAEYQNWRTPTASVWAETLLNKTTYKDDGKPDGFSGSSTGFTVGLDTVMMDIAAAGVGYAHTTTDITALNRKTTFTSNTLFVYGTFKPNETYLSAIVNFGAGSYDEDKTVGTLKLSDAYDAKQYGVQITAGRNFDVYNPSVGLRYSAVNLDAREDSAGQKVAAQSFKTLTLSVDNRWELPLMQTKWTKTGMNLNVGAAYDISRSADKAEVALSNGASYTVEGAKPDALTFNAGAEVYWIFGRKISLSAKYDADIASSYLSHSVSANLSFQF